MKNKFFLALIFLLTFSACTNSNNDKEVLSNNKKYQYIIPFTEENIVSFFETVNNYNYVFMYSFSNKEWYFNGTYIDNIDTGYLNKEANIINYKIENDLFYILKDNEYVLGDNPYLDLNVSYLSLDYYKEILENNKIIKMKNGYYYIENYNYTFNVVNNVLNIYIDTNYGGFYYLSFKKL